MYFDKLIAASWLAMDKISIGKQPTGLDEISGPLLNKAEAQWSLFLSEIENIERSHFGAPTNFAVGMNTVGMLSDRLTILAIKHWFLRNRYDKPDDAKALYDLQIVELIRALEQAQPGSSSTNNKLTNVNVSTDDSSWERSFFGLLKTNLVLWESQEVLYTRGSESLPDSELRKYITFFGKENLVRNKYIESCERTYWQRFS